MIRERMEAWALDRFSRLYNTRTALLKPQLLEPLRGAVPEIASGTGANLPFYSPDVDWTGVDINHHGHRYAREVASKRGIRAKTICGPAETLPLEARSVDFIVATLALCSVRDPRIVLAEAKRVLRPGGRLVLLEHVAAEAGTSHRRVQERAAPVFRCCLRCNPVLETERLVREAGFVRGEIEHVTVNIPVVRPHIAGTVGL